MLFVILLAGFIGLFFGSFFNVIVDRLPIGESFLTGRSRCDYCHKTLRWFELIPVLSYVLQNGKCLRCHKKLSVRYPISEIGTAMLFMGIAAKGIFHPLWFTFFVFAEASLLWIILWTDLLNYFIPDSVIVIGIVLALFRLLFLPLETVGFTFLAAGAASAFFYFLWYMTKGKGMGFGDVKLVMLLGLLLGFPQLITSLYLAFLTGAAIGIILIVTKKKQLRSRIPFGPFLIVGAAISCFLPPITKLFI